MRTLLLAAAAVLLASCASTHWAPLQPGTASPATQPQWIGPDGEWVLPDPHNFCAHADTGQCRDTGYFGRAHA